MENHFTHIDGEGNARMVDVGGKDVTARSATAVGSITMSGECFALVAEGRTAAHADGLPAQGAAGTGHLPVVLAAPAGVVAPQFQLP